ncbi:PepSY-associated TM helix domain-containing protein [Deinococcus depolymerans]|uniref:PepSY-associated TM helix domain-containing protein n=1 Tax=Deinococcus depolymerans TaxID=392408 RepID=A0ABP3LUA8_9DEIO
MQITLRSLHIYSSMATLLLILFFSGSGVLLNHPDWSGSLETIREARGTLPAPALAALNATPPDWLGTVETLRAAHDLRGRAGNLSADPQEASLTFRAPGRETDVLIDTRTGQYELTTTSAGLNAVIGDLHRGHNTGPGWNWVIDLTALFLTVISASGFGILLFLKKHRPRALLTLGAGTLLLGVGIATLAM